MKSPTTQRTAIEKALDYDAIAQSYMPELSDGVEQDDKNRQGRPGPLYAGLGQNAAQAPGLLFEATHANSHGYYTITKCRAINDYYTFNNDICMKMSEMNVHYLDKSGYLRYAFVQALSAFEKLPLVALTMSIGFMALADCRAWSLARALQSKACAAGFYRPWHLLADLHCVPGQ